MKDLSEQMFRDTHEERKMICSEFSARAIASTMEQVNKLTAFDLQAANMVGPDAKIVKNPIPPHESFDTLHPERLVKLLKNAECLEQTFNKGLQSLVQTENTKKGQSSQLLIENLPKKLYAIMKKSGSSEEFQRNSEQVTTMYLARAKIERPVIDHIVQNITSGTLDKLYQSYKKEPKTITEKIGSFCNKILEVCKLRTKDKEITTKLAQLTFVKPKKHSKTAHQVATNMHARFSKQASVSSKIGGMQTPARASGINATSRGR